MAKVTLREVLQSAMQHLQAGEFAQAEPLFQKILSVQPEEPNSLHGLGLIALQTQRVEMAVDYLRRVVGNYPDFVEAQSNLGAALHAAKRLEEAVECFKKLLARQPQFAQGYFNLARVYKDLGQLQNAQDAYARAIAFNPQLAEAHSNLAAIQRLLGDLPRAAASMRAAIAIKPGVPDFYYFAGVIEKDQHHFEEAINSFRQAIVLDAFHAEAHRDLGYLLLMKKDFSQGLREHEWRWKCKDAENPYPDPVQPAWDGLPLKGRSLFLVTEQGLGDSLQYIRYVPLVAGGGGDGGSVHLVCAPALKRLLAAVPGVTACYTSADVLPLTDVYTTTMTLPYLMKTTFETIPHEVPYLKPVENDVAQWREKLKPYAGTVKVGIVWAGNPKHTNDRYRSIAISLLAPIFATPGVTFFNLQKGALAGDIAAFSMVDFTGELNDFADTAALVSELDLVITVDTSVAHLAGALGKATWVLIPYVPDWRWFLDRADSPWYPTVRLFRQPSQGDWETVLGEVAAALKGLAFTLP